jgi:hypothetical protein
MAVKFITWQLKQRPCTSLVLAITSQSFGSPGVLVTEFIIAAIAAGTILLV